MNREQWDKRLPAAADRYNRPPETPREEIWSGIEAARAVRRRDSEGGQGAGSIPTRVRREPPIWLRRGVLWPAAAAAVLLLGIAIGRLSFPEGEMVAERTLPTARTSTVSPRGGAPQVETLPTETPSATPRSGDPAAAYRFAASPLFGRAETLLLQLMTQDRETSQRQKFSTRAADLLAETRLLLDSPAADTPELRALLEDLELTLTRVVTIAAQQLADEQSDAEIKTLEDALERKAILPRLRTRLATGVLPVSL